MPVTNSNGSAVANFSVEALITAGNGLTVTTGTVSLPADQVDPAEINDNGITLDAGEDELCLSYEVTGGYFQYVSCGGGSQTPWTSDIDADSFDLTDTSNVLFRETTGAPAGTDVGLYRDNTGDLTANVLTGKTFNLAVAGADEYTFSAPPFDLANNNITSGGSGAFTSLSSSGAIASNGGITFDAATDTLGAFTAAGTIDLNANIFPGHAEIPDRGRGPA